MEQLSDQKQRQTDEACASIPRHVGVILDGNRRWAKAHSVPITDAYRRGSEKVGELLTWCTETSIQYVTIWALSTDNLRRPPHQVDPLLRITIDGLWSLAVEQSWRLRPIGAMDLLPSWCREELEAISIKTDSKTSGTANIAVAYGGRHEILAAVSRLVVEQVAVTRQAEDSAPVPRLTEDHFARYLFTAGQPDPDLVIRTSGEQRLSGFMPWQTSGSELYFSDVCWPDFSRTEFSNALMSYASRQRRFGQ